MAHDHAIHSDSRVDVQATDLVVIGSGPAGMAAASAARHFGASVVVLDEQHDAGGQIYRGIADAPDALLEVLGPDYAAGAQLASEFRQSGARHIPGAAVWHISQDRQVHYLHEGQVRSLRAKRVLLCTGAIERPFPIPGWTLPGVLTAGAAQILLKASGMRPTLPVVLAGCGPLLYLLGWQYVRAGVPIAALVDTTQASDYWRAARHAGGALVGWRYLKKGMMLMRALKKARVPVYAGAQGLQVFGDRRAQGLSFVRSGRPFRVESQLVLLHQGVVPNTQFTWALRASHRWDDQQLCWAPITDAWGELNIPGVFVAGDGRAIGGALAAAIQGRIAALAAATQIGKLPHQERDRLVEPLRAGLRMHLSIRPFLDALYRPKAGHRIPSDSTIVCRCEEVTAGDIRRYVELGCTGPNQAKSFGRCGMGPCQGRQCGLTVTEVIASARGVPAQEVGYFRIRPPVKPITLGELANDA